jgi:hypothetical protein
MSNLLNKSNHPVLVKRISVRAWRIRDEIEYVIAKRIAQCEQDGRELDIEDIRAFYTRSRPDYLDPDYDPEDSNQDNVIAIGSDGKDSSGNEMDEEALAMMAALQGGDEQEESEDDAAARMAAEMLGDQAGALETSTEQDDEAARMAQEMLGEQIAPSKETSYQTSSSLKQAPLARTIPPAEKVSGGFTLLSDLNMNTILIFSKQGYSYGQAISIEFLIPKSFIVTGEVKTCVDLGRKSKIISESKPNYRVEVELTYLWDGERANLRDFLKSIEPEIPPPPQKLKRPDKDEGGDDEFEDLGF